MADPADAVGPQPAPRMPGAARDDGASLRGLLRELPGLLSDRVHLFALELRRSGVTLARMIGLAVAAAVLAAAAWLFLCVGLAWAAVHAGMPPGWAMVILVLVNALGSLLLLWRVRALAPRLAMPATVRSLTVAPHPSHRDDLRSGEIRDAQEAGRNGHPAAA